MKKYRRAAALAAAAVVMMLYGCSPAGGIKDGADTNAVSGENANGQGDVNANGSEKENVPGGANAGPADVSDVFSSRDISGEYDEGEAVKLALSEGENIITEAGVYIVSGTVGDGSLIVDAGKGDKVQIVLDGADITREGFAALYVRGAAKVFVTLAEGSENSLCSKGEFTHDNIDGDVVNVDGAVFSRDDITVNGSGKLSVTSECGDGIVSKDELLIAGGELTVSAPEGHALSGKDIAAVGGGVLTLFSGKDGIRSENSDDAERGNVVISGGSITVTSEGDGIYASGNVTISGGETHVTAGGGSKNGESHSDGMWGRPGGAAGTDTDADTASRKGVKADGGVFIIGGSVTADCADDAVHSGGDAVISGGELSLMTGDDGVHADGNVTISGGELEINESYEGVEGKTITVSGGSVAVNASDDGFNASDGSGELGGMFGVRPGGDPGGQPGVGDPGGQPGGNDDGDGYGDVYLLISGGSVYVNASGDGLDSNGGLYVTGGETYVDGPTNSGNGALDYGTEAKITGGVVVAVGASGMAENFGSDSTQGAIMYNASGAAGEKITLKDGDGGVIAEHTPKKAYSSVVVSAPGIVEGGKYTLTLGGSSYEIEMASLIYGEGGFGGGRPGGMGGGRPGGFGGRR